jgi:predicted RNase H-like nuclease (RuvC/YqgF family)
LAQAKRDAQVSAELDVRCQTLTATIAAQAKEIDQLRKQVSQQQQQIQQQQQLLDSSPLQHSANGLGDLASLKTRLGKLEDELEDEKATHKRLMLHKNREYRELTEELEHERAVCQELRQEIAALKKGRTSDRSHRSPSTSRFDPTAYLSEQLIERYIKFNALK